MIICTECGHRNEDGDDFCGSCGAFLEFSGERTAADEPGPADEAVPEADEARATLVDRVKAAVGLGEQPDGERGAPSGERGAGATTGAAGSPAAAAVAVDAAAAAAEAEALELRRRSDEEAQRRAEEARRLADEATAAAEAARQAAEAEARRADDAEARQAAERAAREEAERAVAEAQEQVRLAAAAAESAAQERAAAEAEERERAASAEAVEAEREAAAAAARASAEAELARRAEAERVAREAAQEEARQRAEAEARELAERAAREEAEAARRQAEEQAAAAKAALDEAEARAREAEQAARMAALVAKAKPTPAVEPTPTPAPTPTPTVPGPPDAPAAEGAVARPAGGRKPEAVKPQRQRVKRTPAAAAPEEVLNPGDLVCGGCGAGNDPERRFCRRCGSSLVAAATVPRPPWYRRIFQRRPKAKPEAGTRPDQVGGKGQGMATRGKYAFLRARSTSRKVGRIVALLALVGVAGLSLGPWKGAVGDQLDKVKRIISPDYEPVRPASASASSELDGHPATAATDQVSNSYWAEGAEGTGEGQGLTFTFDQPVDLDRIGFLNGASEDPKDFVTQPRVREVQLLFDDGTTKALTIKDEAEFQEFGIEARDVTTVQLQIVSVYPSLDGSAASLAEVEFFRKE